MLEDIGTRRLDPLSLHHITQKELCDRLLDGLEMDTAMKKELHLVDEADMRDASDNANLFVNFVDYRTGLALDPKMVQEARTEEMQIFAEMGVYEHAPEQEFQADPHATLIGTTWADFDER